MNPKPPANLQGDSIVIQTDHVPAKALKPGRWPDSGDFRRLWLIGAFQYSVRWLDTLALSVFAYQATGSAFIVTMLAMLRVLPSALFGLFTGMAADRFEGRTILLTTLSVSCLTSSTMATLAYTGHLALWHLAISAFIGGTVWSSDIPLRRLMIGRVVGPELMANAMALDAGSNNASRIVGPAIGGTVLSLWGLGGCFLVGAILFFVALLATSSIRYRHPPRTVQVLAPTLRGIVAAVKGPIQEKPLAGFFTITLIFNMFCLPITSLVPLIGHDHFNLSTRNIGLLASMDGVGALIGAVILFIYTPPAYYARIYVFSVVTYAAGAMAIAVLPHPALAGLALIIAGFGSVGFSVMQSTLIFNGVRPEMRAIMLGLFTVSTGIAPLGLLQIGVLADLFGVQIAALVSGTEALVAVFLTRSLWRQIGRQ